MKSMTKNEQTSNFQEGSRNYKKSHMEILWLKSTGLKMTNWLERLNSRVRMAEQTISYREDQSVRIVQSEEQTLNK